MKQADAPAGLPEGQLQLIYTGRHYRVFRDVRQGQGVVLKRLDLKEYDARAISSLRHEFEILSSVDVPGVVKAREISASDERLTLVLEDAGETNLGERVKIEFP